jgi:VWFA-related protein
MRNPRHLLPVLLVATICGQNFVSGQSMTGSSQETSNLAYHSTVSEVRLVFFATDEHNHLVQELRKDDFAVVDNESVIRDFRSFSHADLVKLDVVVLVDSSESVLPHFEEEIADVQKLISHSRWGSEDKVSVLSFSGLEARLVCSGDCRSSFKDRIASLPRGGATPLFDALEVATEILIERRQPDVWPVIILFSDGDDTISKAALQDISGRILEVGAQIYAVDLSNPRRPSNGTATLQRIADNSGGRCIRTSEGAARIFDDVIDDLHSARAVTYVPPQSGSEFHSVRIFPTHNLGWQFRCRSSYYYRSNTAHQEDSP